MMFPRTQSLPGSPATTSHRDHANTQATQRPKTRAAVHAPGDTIDNGRYTVRQVVGTGAFGVVYHAVDCTGRSFAIKTLFPDEPQCVDMSGKKSARRQEPRRRLCQRFDKEAYAHAAVNGHSSVVNLRHTFTEGSRCYFVFDLYCGGTLLHAITEQDLFWNDDQAITNAFLQIVDAVAHCHRRRIAHRDLKPDNVLLSDDGSSFFLADFGLATSDRHCGQFGAGSKHYKSPECIGTEFVGKTYDTHASDVWSLGIILVNMITGGHPWTRAHTTDPNFAAYLRDRNHLANALPIAPHAAQLICRILEPNVVARITLPELFFEVSRVGRWGLDDAELAFATDAARASFLSYARTLNIHYELPPAVRHEPRFMAPGMRRSGPVPPPITRQHAYSPSTTSRFATDLDTRPSSSVHTPGTHSPAASMVIEFPVPTYSPKRSSKRSLLLRSLRRIKVWDW